VTGWQEACLKQAMPGIDFSAHVTNPIALGLAPAAAKAPADDSGFSFYDFLDVINPLQHIPVISTLYRHFTGDQIDIPEKVAGDTLYGGLTGLFASLGDVLFQEITGKNVGDTVYAMVMGDDTPSTAIATAPVSVTPASAISISSPDIAALTNVLNSKGVDADTAQRAIFAYGRAIDRSEQIY
jgi:hypothetical protein